METLSEHVYGFKDAEGLAALMRTQQVAWDAAHRVFALAVECVEMEAEYLDELEEFLEERYRRVAEEWELADAESLSPGTPALCWGRAVTVSALGLKPTHPDSHLFPVKRWLVSPHACTPVIPGMLVARRKA